MATPTLPIRPLLATVLIVAGSTAGADDRADVAAAKAELQRRADRCLSSPEQSVGFQLVPTVSPPLSEPASADEEARVKRLLESSGLPYDRVRHRSSYEFTLSLVRTRNTVVFTIRPSPAAEAGQPVRDCLAKVAASFDLPASFDAPRP